MWGQPWILGTLSQLNRFEGDESVAITVIPDRMQHPRHIHGAAGVPAVAVVVAVGGAPRISNRVDTCHVVPMKIWISYTPSAQPPSGKHSV